MTEDLENEKVYWLFKAITITIAYIVIGIFAIFFIAAYKVDALQLTYDNLPQDGKPYVIGTRSGGTITTRSITWNTLNNQIPPFEEAIVQTDSQYWSVGLQYNAIKDRVYKIKLYYDIAPTSGSPRYYFNELSGVCTGYNSTCNQGSQTSNYTRLLFNSNNTTINISNTALLDTTIPDVSPGIRQAYTLDVMIIANANGPYITLYLNATGSGRLFLISSEIEDLGESSNVLKSYMDVKTQSIIDWTTAKTDELALDISGVGDKVEDLKTNAQNWYTWTIV